MFERFKRIAVFSSALIVLVGAFQLLRGAARVNETLENYSAPQFAVALVFAVSSVICAWFRVDRHFRKLYGAMHEVHVIEQSCLDPAVYVIASIGSFLLVGLMCLVATADGFGAVISISIVSLLYGFRKRPTSFPSARLVK